MDTVIDKSNNLPKDWKWVKLGDVLSVSSGKGIKVNSLQGGKYAVYGGNGLNGYHSEYLIEEPKLIIGRVGVKCGVMHITKPKSWVTDNALVVEPKNDAFDIQFLKFKLEFENLNKLSVSTAQPVISGSKIYAYEISLPPKPTQQAIVSKIEELFSELDKGIENLRTAQQQIKTYRQSVLKWAFEGKLTNENVKEGELPKGWKWVLINEIGRIKGGKRLPPKHQYSEEPTDFVYIMAGNLKEGTVRNKSTFIREETYNALLNYKVTGGEVYITIVGACIGDAGIIPENIGKSILTENAAKIIELKDTYNKYLALWINSTICQANIKSKILSATLGKLALNRIGTLEVPIAPIKEQHKIVQEIESRLSVADKMEESITQSLQQAEALRQSILKKAFEGELI